jgi:hypothetical protein
MDLRSETTTIRGIRQNQAVKPVMYGGKEAVKRAVPIIRKRSLF